MPRTSSQSYIQIETPSEVLEAELEVGSSNDFQELPTGSNLEQNTSTRSRQGDDSLPTSYTYNSAATYLTSLGYKTTNHTVKRWIDRLMLAYRDRAYLLVVKNSRNEVTAISPEGMSELEAICRYKSTGGTVAEYMESLTRQKREEVEPEKNSSALVVVEDLDIYQGELVEEIESSAFAIREISDEFEEMMLELARQEGEELAIKVAAVKLSTFREKYDEHVQKSTQAQKKKGKPS